MHLSVSCLLLIVSLLLANSKSVDNTWASTGQAGCSTTCINYICQTKCDERNKCQVCINNICTNDCVVAGQMQMNGHTDTVDLLGHPQQSNAEANYVSPILWIVLILVIKNQIYLH